MATFNRLFGAHCTEAALQAATLAPAEAKLKSILEVTGATATLISQYAIVRLDGLITMKNLDAQMSTLMRKICGQMAKEGQSRWRESLNFLSFMQQSRSDAVKQVADMMSLRDQSMHRSIQHLLA